MVTKTFGKVRAPVKVTLNGHTCQSTGGLHESSEGGAFGMASVARTQLLAPARVCGSDRGSGEAGNPRAVDRSSGSRNPHQA